MLLYEGIGELVSNLRKAREAAPRGDHMARCNIDRCFDRLMVIHLDTYNAIEDIDQCSDWYYRSRS